MVVVTVLALSLGLFLGLLEPRLAVLGHRIATAVSQFQAGATTLDFGTAMTAISVALARVQGMLRVGLGWTQQASGRHVHTLRTPVLDAASSSLSVLSIVGLLQAASANLVLGVRMLWIDGPMIALDSWAELLSALRWFGLATYLLGVALGLAAVFKELSFQAVRTREMSHEPPRGS